MLLGADNLNSGGSLNKSTLRRAPVLSRWSIFPTQESVYSLLRGILTSGGSIRSPGCLASA